MFRSKTGNAAPGRENNWRTRIHVPWYVIDRARGTYEAAPNCTIDGIAFRYGLNWRVCYEILAAIGRPGWRNLIQERIDHPEVIAAKIKSEVRREPAAVQRYLEILDQERMDRYRQKHPLKPPRKKKPARVPYVSMIGASARAAAKLRWARQHPAPPRKDDAATEQERNAQIRELVQKTKDVRAGLRYVPPRP